MQQIKNAPMLSHCYLTKTLLQTYYYLQTYYLLLYKKDKVKVTSKISNLVLG